MLIQNCVDFPLKEEDLKWSLIILRTNHGKNHFEFFNGMECMRFVCRHYNHLPFLKDIFTARNSNFCLAIYYLNHGIEGSCMFTQSFSFIEGKYSHSSRAFTD